MKNLKEKIEEMVVGSLRTPNYIPQEEQQTTNAELGSPNTRPVNFRVPPFPKVLEVLRADAFSDD